MPTPTGPTPPSRVPPAARRRFGVTDALVLVAATAVGLALWRPFFVALWSLPGGSLDAHFYWYLTSAGSYPLASWSLGLAALSLRPPRPRLRRLIRSPAVIPGAAVLLGLGLHAAGFAAAFVVHLVRDGGYLMRPWTFLPAFLFRLTLLLPSEVGLAVALVWTAQALGNRSPRRTSWADPVGRVLGVAWILLGVITFTGYLRLSLWHA